MPRKAKQRGEERQNIKVIKFQVVHTPEFKENVSPRWKGLSIGTQQITNCYYRTWLAEHTRAGSGPLVRRFLNEYREWRRKGSQGEKPKCPVEFDPPGGRKVLSETVIQAQYPEVHSRIVELVVQRCRKDLMKPAKKSSFSLWMQILSDMGEYPSSSSPRPILFDRRNGEIIENEDGTFSMSLTMTRLPRDGKKATSITDVVALRTIPTGRGRRAAGLRQQVAILKQIVDGEFKFAGSQVEFDQRTNTFSVAISYSRPVEVIPALDREIIGVIRPGATCCWQFRWTGNNRRRPMNIQHYLIHTRRSLTRHHIGLNQSYKNASSSRRGHGRQRACKHTFKLDQRWKNFTRTANYQMVSEIIKLCKQNEIGTLVFRQPAGDYGDRRFLASAGADNQRFNARRWDWAQVATILKNKCQEHGINLVLRKYGETSMEESKAA